MSRTIRLRILACTAGLVLLASATGWAITRINGNQLLEASGEYGFANNQKATASSPPRLVFSFGQGVTASGQLPDSAHGTAFFIGFGLGYDVAHYLVCPVGTTGDLNSDSHITSSDLIQLIQVIYNGASSPEPCAAVGDVNCSGNITAGDVMCLVNFIFKSGKPPCNVCSLFPDTWPCPH